MIVLLVYLMDYLVFFIGLCEVRNIKNIWLILLKGIFWVVFICGGKNIGII